MARVSSRASTVTLASPCYNGSIQTRYTLCRPTPSPRPTPSSTDTGTDPSRAPPARPCRCTAPSRRSTPQRNASVRTRSATWRCTTTGRPMSSSSTARVTTLRYMRTLRYGWPTTPLQSPPSAVPAPHELTIPPSHHPTIPPSHHPIIHPTITPPPDPTHHHQVLDRARRAVARRARGPRAAAPRGE